MPPQLFSGTHGVNKLVDDLRRASVVIDYGSFQQWRQNRSQESASPSSSQQSLGASTATRGKTSWRDVLEQDDNPSILGKRQSPRPLGPPAKEIESSDEDANLFDDVHAGKSQHEPITIDDEADAESD